ncbi:MAG: NAD(P)-dependent oxidoreductase [Flavobacteriales bacterium]|jgi:saccharopine dehydrogenase (NAD+, L-lysine-forming)
MEKVILGIVREGKVPPDFRVPLTPEQCIRVMEEFPHLEVIVQPSPIRKFQDDEYRALGIRMEEDLSHCDYLMGVKEVPLDMLIPNKSYLFFSHTLKKQPHNAKLLKTILEKKIRLIDYETLKGTDGKRIIGFGRYAGIVGAYHGFRTLGLKKGWYELKRPVDCADRKEMESEMSKIQLPKNTKIVVTGFGRVGNGASEIFQLLPIRKVTPKQFLTEEFDEPVYVHLDTHEYYERKVDGGFDKKDFYNNPDHYFSILPTFVKRSDMYVACHLWAGGNPVLITNHDISQSDWKCMVIADVSCDTNGPIAPTIRASKIADPIFGYDRMQHVETDYKNDGAIAVMSIDNLPCELPKDASEDFGDELLRSVFPLLFGEDPHDIIWKATETTLKGELTPHFEYLHDYVSNA